MITSLIRRFDAWFLGGIDFGKIDNGWFFKLGDKWVKFYCEMDIYIGVDCARGMSYSSVLYPTRKKQSFEALEKIINDTLVNE